MTYFDANNLVEIDNKQTEAHSPGWGQFVPRISEVPLPGKVIAAKSAGASGLGDGRAV
jgi:hypothetical protein